MEQCKDAELMLKLKIIVVLFCNTIEEVQFPTIQLSDMLKEIRDKYYNMLLIKWNERIKKILLEDNYNCMEIETEEAYNRLMEIFPIKLSVSINSDVSSTSSTKFLKQMPYSACVPKLFIDMKEFVNNCVKFAEGLNSR
jgi:hypothetical protein